MQNIDFRLYNVPYCIENTMLTFKSSENIFLNIHFLPKCVLKVQTFKIKSIFTALRNEVPEDFELLQSRKGV